MNTTTTTTTTTNHTDLAARVIDLATDWLAELRERSRESVASLAGEPSDEAIAGGLAVLLDIEREVGVFVDAVLRIGGDGRDVVDAIELDDRLSAALCELCGATDLADVLAVHDADVADVSLSALADGRHFTDSAPTE